jgi:hypothetical protein
MTLRWLKMMKFGVLTAVKLAMALSLMRSLKMLMICSSIPGQEGHRTPSYTSRAAFPRPQNDRSHRETVSIYGPKAKSVLAYGRF